MDFFAAGVTEAFSGAAPTMKYYIFLANDEPGINIMTTFALRNQIVTIMKLSEQRSSMLHGVLLIALFACAAYYIGDTKLVKTLSLSPMIVGIVLGMMYANSLRNNLPETWVPGIKLCSKQILRTGIVLYGFRLTFQDIMNVGIPAIVADAFIVCTTIGLGVLIGKLLKIDRSIALLTSCGSAICGAAAVLGVDGAIRPKPYKTAVAVATVVIFGTLAMFLYPVLYRAGIFDLTPEMMGLFSGATIHEVAHVVGAANAMGAEVSNNAIIVKMIRVMMLVPVLLVIAWAVARSVARRNDDVNSEDTAAGQKSNINIPWFAIFFLVVIGFNSFGLLSAPMTEAINYIDTFLLTMAMTALGAETSIDKFKKAGAKPFVLAAILFCWLTGGGYILVKYVVPTIL